jgi:hypothetical protein
MEQDQRTQVVQQTSNQAYIEPNVLQLRLDTNELLERIETFLSGKKLIYKEIDGNIQAVKIDQGQPILNTEGTQCIVSWVGMQLTPSTVQGYIKDDEEYGAFLERTRKELARIVLVNSPSWKIKRERRKLIMSSIMNMIQLFVSRTRENTERQSYLNNIFQKGLSTAPATQHI